MHPRNSRIPRNSTNPRIPKNSRNSRIPRNSRKFSEPIRFRHHVSGFPYLLESGRPWGVYLQANIIRGFSHGTPSLMGTKREKTGPQFWLVHLRPIRFRAQFSRFPYLLQWARPEAFIYTPIFSVNLPRRTCSWRVLYEWKMDLDCD
jgi:hypothetical protein